VEILNAIHYDLRSLVEAASPPRSEGLHCSRIIQDLVEALNPERTRTNDDPPWARFSLGYMAEDLLGDYWARRQLPYERPGEFIRDGVICSPDGIDPSRWAVVEVKCTHRSSRHDLKSLKCWAWIVQVKAYCYAIHSDLGEIWAVHLNGDYQQGGPEVRVSQVRFSAQELIENWQMLLARARSRHWL
jgi:hypothetical protein